MDTQAAVTNWRKSSASAQGESCVEVGTADAVLVRDTTQNGTGPVLSVSAAAWGAFLAAIR
jgi:hypothetical protein